jgi:hypothetical protein
MLRTPVAIAILALASMHVLMADESVPQKARDLAGQRWGNNLRQVERIATPAVKAVFKDKTVLRAVVFNPKSRIAGRETFNHALVLDGDKAEYIETDEQAVAIMSKQAVATGSAEQAATLAQAFVDLRGYAIRAAGHADDGDVDRARDYTQSTTGTADGWVVSFALDVDPAIKYCARYKLAVKKDGTLSIAGCSKVCIHGGYD